jgi:hypothetical protein
MLIRRSQGLADYGVSIAWGCLVAGLGITLVNFGLPQLEKWWVIPGVAVFYALCASPFAALGLALIGVPAALLLRPYAQLWRVAALAGIVGALAGELAFFILKQLVVIPIGILEGRPGSMVGIPTALTWWWLRRSVTSSGN